MYIVLILLLLPLSIVTAEEPAKEKKYSNTGELSYVDSSGNTDTTSFSVNNKFTYKFTETFKSETKFGGHYAESNSVATAERYIAALRFDKNFTKRFFSFLQGSWERDRFSGTDNKYSSGLGLGLVFFKDKRHDLRGDTGFNYVVDERTTGEIKRSPSSIVNLNYKWKITDTASFAQDAFGNFDLDDQDNWDFESVTSLTFSLNTYLALKNSYRFTYKNEPVPGFSTTDRMVTIALVINF